MELKDFPELFLKHPLVQKVIKDDASATADRRKAALLEISALETVFRTDTGKAEADIDAADTAVKDAAAALEKARVIQGAAAHRKACLAAAFNRLQSAHTAILMETYPPSIDEFLHDMRSALDTARAAYTGTRSGTDPELVDEFTGEALRYVSTNIPAAAAAYKYIIEAIKEVENWKTADLEGIDVTARLQELRKGIPPTDVFICIDNPKPNVRALQRHVDRPRKGNLEWWGSDDFRHGEWRPVGGWM